MSQYWLTKNGDIQGKDYPGDLATASIASSVDRRFEKTYKEDIDGGDVTATLTIDQLIKGLVYSNPGGAITLTTPSAANIVSGDVDSEVGRGFEFSIINKNGVGTITLGLGAGITLTGSSAIAISSSATFYVRYTNVTNAAEAVEIFRK